MLNRISSFVGRYMAVLILLMAALALFVPASCLWIPTYWVSPLLMIVMFGMGLTLNPRDFAVVFQRPKDILIGCAAQFTIMPLLAIVLGKLFRLDDAFLVGVVLVGTCPGGTSSNVITYLSGGDVPLSIGMTGVNTLLAPVLTPFLTWLLLRASVQVNIMSMFLSILEVVVLPILLGMILSHFFGRYLQPFHDALPLVSVLAIIMIMATVVSHSADRILNTSAIVFAVVILHNLLGYACGWGLALLLHLPLPKRKALAIEVGMQNSGLATSLAAVSFAEMPMAAVPGAIFSVWHNLSGALLANRLRRMTEKEGISPEDPQA